MFLAAIKSWQKSMNTEKRKKKQKGIQITTHNHGHGLLNPLQPSLWKQMATDTTIISWVRHDRDVWT